MNCVETSDTDPATTDATTKAGTQPMVVTSRHPNVRCDGGAGDTLAVSRVAMAVSDLRNLSEWTVTCDTARWERR